MSSDPDLKVGDPVARATHRTERNGKKTFIPGVQGTVGGSAAAHLSVNRVYRVKGFTYNGGVLLHDFLLPVSARDLIKVGDSE